MTSKARSFRTAPQGTGTPQGDDADNSVILDDGGSVAGDSQDRRLPGSRSAFHFVVNLLSLQLVNGELVADLPPIPHTPGVNGAMGDGNPGMALQVQMKKGAVVIPHSAIPCTAFGQSKRSYLARDPGTDGDWYHDVWNRYERFGNQVIHDIDAEGFLAFRKDALRYALAAKGLDEVPPKFRALAERRIRDELVGLMGRDDDAGKARRALLERILNGPAQDPQE